MSSKVTVTVASAVRPLASNSRSEMVAVVAPAANRTDSSPFWPRLADVINAWSADWLRSADVNWA